MEADFDEITLIQHPGPGPRALPTPCTALAFDPSQELLWTGNQYGRVMSFFGRDLPRYTSYKGHAGEAVKQILFTDKGVLSVSAHIVHLASRRGPAIWHLTDERFTELTCMSFTSKGTQEVLVAGRQGTMFKIDVERGAILETLAADDHYTLMKKGGQYICAANDSGKIHILDSNTLKVIKGWSAHSGRINDMDVRSDFIVTCGFSPRHPAGFMLDGFANVFNLKTMQPLPPIPFQAGAAFVRMHPRMSTTSFVASASGQLQVVDVMNPSAVSWIRQASIFDNGVIMHMEVSPSGQALAFTNSHSYIHLWGSPNKINFTDYSADTVFPDNVPPHQTMDYWSPDTPLNVIGMPYYREVLLSAWPNHLVFDVGMPPPRVDQNLLLSLQRSEMGYFGPNQQKGHRNQIERARIPGKTASLAAPKFLSERARDAVKSGIQEDNDRRVTDAMEAMNDLALDGVTKKDVPVIYRNVEIKYSKFGVDDFDFQYYNRTNFSGLETHITNSYANPLLQIFRFTPVLRNIALRHTATACPFETCLLCELGFLVDMLEKAAGLNCQATNFLKIFSSLSSAMTLELLEEHSPNTPLSLMIQKLNRFLLEKLSQDWRQVDQSFNHLESALSTKMNVTIRCTHCHSESVLSSDLYFYDLTYPPKMPMSRNSPRGAPRQSFSQILKASVERQEQARGWCSRCRRYQQMSQRRQVQSVPAVLMINTEIKNADAKQAWSHPNCLPQEIGIIAGNGQFFCYEGQDLQLHLQRGVHAIQVYELIGVVADVNSGEDQKSHLVSMINVAPSSRDQRAVDQWHIFNDFLVRRIPKEEALSFDASWKLPSILTYQLKVMSHFIDDHWKNVLDTSLLYKKVIQPGILYRHEENLEEFRRLSVEDEAPRPGTLVGIDAEFIALRQEEIDMKPDGTREIIRPSRLGLARVSVLRGTGIDQDLPFIDDYIAISEPIVDYLTEYSGISPGDLDRTTSNHVLVSLKVAYKKLWLLLNLGCVFVGHGLIKDFRTINIHVPKNQVIDTVELFHIKARARKLSLRFLAWTLLREHIQSETHDSIEDARTALRLWRKYEEFSNAAVLEEQLEWIYKEGMKNKFKVPEREGASSSMTSHHGLSTPGRDTPEPSNRSGSSFAGEAGLAGRVEGSTPGRFGTAGKFAFDGSPMR